MPSILVQLFDDFTHSNVTQASSQEIFYKTNTNTVITTFEGQLRAVHKYTRLYLYHTHNNVLQDSPSISTGQTKRCHLLTLATPLSPTHTQIGGGGAISITVVSTKQSVVQLQRRGAAILSRSEMGCLTDFSRGVARPTDPSSSRFNQRRVGIKASIRSFH